MKTWKIGIILLSCPAALLLIVNLLGSSPPQVVQGWPMAVRAAVCLGGVVIASALCPVKARGTIVPMLLAVFVMLLATSLGAGSPLALLAGAPFFIFMLLHAWREKRSLPT